jgi:SNF2 family DNA or RNA helicase
MNRTGLRRAHVTCPAAAVPNWHREIGLWARRPEDWTVSSFDASSKELPVADVHICDEAHFLKTPGSGRTRKLLLAKNSRMRCCARTWALSGTPAPNTPDELWTWMYAAGLTKLGYQGFLTRFCRYYATDYGVKIVGLKNVDELAEMLNGGFMLRRTVGEVLSGLPDITFGTIKLTSTPQADAALVELPDLEDEEHVARIRRLIGLAKAAPLGAILADRLATTPGKIVVFAHHRMVMDILETLLAPFGVARLDGRTQKAARGAVVSQFQTDPNTRVFIGQITAAGTAITLTAANYLVFAERSFTPEDNTQVWKRIHRWGQKHACHVDFAHLTGSIDEGVVSVNDRKHNLLGELYRRINDR